MKVSVFLITILYCEATWSSEGICEYDRLKFEDAPYIITELNDPEFVPLGTSVTYTTRRYNACDLGCANLAWHNAEVLAGDWLYDRVQLTTGEVIGWECGGGVTCKAPLHAHNVQCTVEVGDCDYFEDDPDKSPYTFFKIKRIFSMECLGDESCKYEGRPVTDCCIITSTKRLTSG